MVFDINQRINEESSYILTCEDQVLLVGRDAQ
jgi:hypothetical protein